MLKASKLLTPGLRIPFSNTLLSLKLALRVVKKIPIMYFLRVCVLTKIPKFMLKASKLWIPGLQDSIFQHLLEPEAGPEGSIRKY